MGESSWLIEIVFLAMLAGFIALRLYHVLGRRTGSEQPAGDKLPRTAPEVSPIATGPRDVSQPATFTMPADTDASLRGPLQAIAGVDRGFDPARFLTGAQAAYRMILEAFWRGDTAALDGLVADDVAINFKRAIAERDEQGLKIDNRLIQLDAARIVDARMNGTMAEVTVRFDADLIAVTRDKSGAITSGSDTNAVETHDVWTFSRHTSSNDPNWLLVATDAEG